MPSSVHSMASSPRELQPHLPVALRIVAPTCPHLDEQEQVHGLFQDLSQLAPRLGADRPDRLPVLAEHDLTLACALDIDGLLDTNRAVFELSPLVCFHR